jgi:serine phosphatase RsbU (regulator of sigma subunit)
MSNESVYATAVCLRVDPRRAQVCWASAAHPPVLVSGEQPLRELPATTVILGAVDDSEFSPDEQTAPLVRGQSLLVYTDGAFEIFMQNGRILGLGGLRRIAVEECREGAGWAYRTHRAGLAVRSGPPTDDTLIVQIRLT